MAASDHQVPRNLALDLVRGLAALGVAVYHYLHWATGRQVESLGTFTVYVFFVLSGLTMMYVYAASFRDGISPGVARTFYLRRFARLFPLLAAVSVASLVVNAALLHMPAAGETARAALTASGLFGLHMPGFLANAPGSWSLGIEAIFYAVFPVVAMAACRARLSTLIGTVIALLVAQQALLFLLQGMLAADYQAFWDYYTSPLTFAPFFAMGILAYRLKLPDSAMNLVAALALLAALALFSFLVPGELFGDQAAYLGLSLASGGAVLFAYSARVPALLGGFAGLMGDVSYSLYLTHPFSWRVVQVVSPRLGLTDPLRAVFFFALALAVAYATYRLFELPAKTWLQRRLGAKVPAAAKTTDKLRAASSAP